MSLFLPNIPQPDDNLDFSQGQLLSNNQGLDIVFGIDHYKFSDNTGNKGFHNKVTTPNFGGIGPFPNSPPATSAAPIFYGFKQLNGAGNPTNQLPVLQYSISTNNAVATPVTSLQSQAAAFNLAAGTAVDILDFTGIVNAYGTLYVVATNNVIGGTTSIASYLIYWDGASFFGNFANNIVGPFRGPGNKLQLKNSTTNPYIDIYWTLVFQRIDSI